MINKKLFKKNNNHKLSTANGIIVAVICFFFFCLFLKYHVYAFASFIGIFLSIFLKKVLKKTIYKNTNHRQMILKEKLLNSSLMLADKTLGICAEIPNISYEKGKIVVTLDRSDKSLLSFFRYALKSDLCLISVYMHLLKNNFFISEDKLTGCIKYGNVKKTLEYSDEKTKKLLSEVNKFVSQNAFNTTKNFKGNPSKCLNCEYIQKGCNNSQKFTDFLVKKSVEEDVEVTYTKFIQASTNLFDTYWKHFENDAQNLVKVIHSSKAINSRVETLLKNAETFDVKEIINSAILHQSDISNRYLSSKQKRELVFSYQLLLLFNKKGNVGLMRDLFGRNKSDDYYDDKIKKFFKINLRNFISDIDKHLKKHIPEDRLKQIQQNFTFYYSQVNFAEDDSSINASMSVEK
jgi:hypothetical protein